MVTLTIKSKQTNKKKHFKLSGNDTINSRLYRQNHLQTFTHPLTSFGSEWRNCPLTKSSLEDLELAFNY